MSPKAAHHPVTQPNGARKRAGSTSSAAGRARSIRVELGERSYSIRIGTDRMAALGDEVARTTGAKRVVVITEPKLGRRYGPALLRSLRSAGIKADKLEVPAGDSTKSLRQVARLYDDLKALCQRDDTPPCVARNARKALSCLWQAANDLNLSFEQLYDVGV